MATIKELQALPENEGLTFMQCKLLKFYMDNSDKFHSDFDAHILIGCALSSVKTLRGKIIKKGHSFTYETEIKKGNKIANRYKYTGLNHTGTTLVDTIKKPVNQQKILDIFPRLGGNNTVTVLTAIAEYQKAGQYWTYEDIINDTGASRKNVLSAIQSFKRCYGFKFHSRGNIKKRQYLVTDITGEYTQYLCKPKAKKERIDVNKLFNKVFF